MTNDPEEQIPSGDTAGGGHVPSAARDDAPSGPIGRSRDLNRSPDAGVGPQPLLGRGAIVALTVWGVVVLMATTDLASATPLWPLVPIVGVILPLGLLFLAVWHSKNQTEALRGREVRAGLLSDERAERELLGALLQSDGLTPASAAARTGLGVSRAAEVLERLASKGHLEVSAVDGDLVYGLRDGGSRAIKGANGADGPSQSEEKQEPTPSVEPPAEPLSEREVEVMRLLASGKTNREIAHELYVSVGTVKAHTANIYRKLGAHNRAEMIGRARSLDLLD